MNDDSTAPVPPPMPTSRRRADPGFGTALALAVVLFVSGGFLAFMAFVTSSFFLMGIIGVPVVIAGLAALHYFTWGYWLQRMQREEKPAQNFWEVAAPPVSDVNPRIR